MLPMRIFTQNILRILYTSITLMIASPVFGQSSLADSLYNHGQYAKATVIYQAQIKQQPTFTAYYNLGNAYYRQHQYANAMLAYQRALKLNPSNNDAKFNIAFLQTKLTDAPNNIEESIIEVWGAKLRDKLNSHQWGILSLMFFLTIGVGCVIFRISKKSKRRKLAFAFIALSFAGFILCIDLGVWQWREYNNTERAVITANETNMHTSPDNMSKHTQTLHEGSVVTIIEHNNNWLQVETSNKTRGWILLSDLEII